MMAPVHPARPFADPAVRRVAVLRARVGLGDLLASVPALRAIRRSRPDLEVVLITYGEVRGIIDRQREYVDDVIAFPGWPGIPDRPVDSERLPAFLEEVKGRAFDLAVQMYGFRAAANEATAALAAPRTGGFFTPGEWQADLATHLPYPIRAHEVDRHLQLVEFLGATATDRRLEFPLTPADRAAAADVRARHGLESGRYVIVHPGASATSRRWLPQRFAEVADGLTDKGWQVVVSGVPAERDATATVIGSTTRGVVDLTGATNLGAFAALLADASLLVANDSGPAHLAAALDVPSVTVFLSGDPVRWAYADDRHPVVRHPVECAPCGLLDCPIDFRCARAVTADEVLHAAVGLLA